ncbi:MAG: AAA family ATPase [bacterium]|nr:AAA family ATPase [bacterium]
MNKEKPIIAVCGKGGVGKTVLTALLSRVLIDEGHYPLLLLDADPAGGLYAAVGQRPEKTLASVREDLINHSRSANDSTKDRLAHELDYMVMAALLEFPRYSLLAMGRPKEKGCFCPANTLLREAIDLLAEPFAVVLIDAEAGLEQIQRQVTRRVTRVLAVSDGSSRSVETIGLIADLVGRARLSVVMNRGMVLNQSQLPSGVEITGVIPENAVLREFDRQGRPLWELPPDNPVWTATRNIVKKLFPKRRTQPAAKGSKKRTVNR